MKNYIKELMLLFLLTGATSVNAAPIVLDFEGLDDQESILDFYNGGTSQNGNSGVDYGVGFSDNTLAVIDADAGGGGNFGGEPSPDTIMFFLTGSESIMNVAAGFDIGFSFFYSAINQAGSVGVYDGLNGSGNLLALLEIPLTPFNGAPDPTGQFSPFVELGVGFAGTAMSVSFAGVGNQIGFDNITFGSVTPGRNGVPEASSIILMGLGLFGLGFTRRQKKA